MIETATWLEHDAELTGPWAGLKDRGDLVAHLADVHERPLHTLPPKSDFMLATQHEDLHATSTRT